eukprot:6103360-Pyramimonas_sp.AAC.1
MLPRPYDPFSADAEKVWYFSGARKTIASTYLQSLLAGAATVHHAGPLQQYRALCDDDGVTLQITDDIGTVARNYGDKKNARTTRGR